MKKQHRLVTFIIAAVLLTTAKYTAAHEVRGVVTDEGGRPLPYATVHLHDLQRSMTTDLAGRYAFADIPQGSHRMSVSFIGRKTVAQTVAVRGDVEMPTIALEEEAVQLSEMLVLPKGMTMEEYILRQVNKNIVPLKKRLPRYEARVTCRMEKDMDLKGMPRRRTVKAAAWVLGYSKILDALLENKYLKLVMTENLFFDNGKMRGTQPRMVEMVPKLSDKQVTAFLKHDELLKANVYDGFYDKVKEKTKEMLKAKRKHDRMDIKYAGSYVLDGRTVYIVKYDNAEIHVVDGCWQILRVRYAEGRNMMYYEFREIKRNVFLPVSGYAEMHLDKEKLPKGSVVMSVAYDYK